MKSSGAFISIAMVCLALLPAVVTAVTIREGASPFAIIPQPLAMEPGRGAFALTPQTVIVYSAEQPDLEFAAGYLREFLKGATGFPFRLVTAKTPPARNAIFLSIDPSAGPGREAYTVEVTPAGARLTGAGTPGALYAVQTLLQLAPPRVFGKARSIGASWKIPSVKVVDQPRYGWRGMMLDVSRHFFTKEYVKKFIDYLVLHKMNTFHWHLSDDQGWRIEIPKFPKLTQVAAWRADKEGMNWNVRPAQQPGEPATYGGYYTQDEIREVVRYAAERQITVVPEIEMPAHVSALLAAYPEYSCTGGPFTVPTGSVWPITDIYCAGNDATFAFLEELLKEIVPLFPGTYFHIGGDEADKTEWRRCPKCQKRIADEKLKNEGELQSYFVKRIERVLSGLGKRLIGWDEILEGGLPPAATVMSWRGINYGIEAAQLGHDVVMAPTSNCYIDYYQGDWRTEPVAIGGSLPISTVYALEPTPESLDADQAKHILGTQGNLWAEFIPDQAKSEYMAFPRIAAIAEVAWSARERRGWADFTLRLEKQMERYDALGVNASRAAFNVVMLDSFDTVNRRRIVSLDSEIGREGIRYTLDGSRPGPRSPLYAGPLTLTKGTTVTAAVFRGKKRLGDERSRMFFSTPAGASLQAVTPPDPRFNQGSLVDNIRARGGSRGGEWFGVKGRDFEATVDLGSPRAIRRLAAGFYHSSTENIFLPETVTFAVSTDGKVFTPAGICTNDVDPKTQQPLVKDYVVTAREKGIRFVRVTATGTKTTPPWHKQAGQPSYLLADEIFIE